MSTHVEAATDESALERWLFGILIGASLINLAANLIEDAGVASPVFIWLVRVTKPVLIPVMAGLFNVRARGREVSVHRGWLYAALLFCWVGDVALLFTHGFVYGMGGFALAHVCFLLGYTKGLSARALLQWDTLLFVLPVAAYGYLVYLTLDLSLTGADAGLALPLAGYMLVLLANGTTCLFRARQGMPGSAFLLLGAVLFILSDSIIALSQFVRPLPQHDFVVMLTYLVGVYWMVEGSLRVSSGIARLAVRTPHPPPAGASPHEPLPE